MVVGDVTTAVDVLVLGAGPGGYVAAIRAAQLGRHVTLVDQGNIDVAVAFDGAGRAVGLYDDMRRDGPDLIVGIEGYCRTGHE